MEKTLTFYKMHGLGNDFVVFDCMEAIVPDFSALACGLCDRHSGIGADGLIAILPSEVADCRMRIFNADGSEAGMCGNGIRCVGKFVHDYGYVGSLTLSVETQSGIKRLKLRLGAGGTVESVTVDMGLPVFREEPLPGGMVALSVGNPHIVKFVEEVASFPVAAIGSELECHPVWPEKANVEFVQVVNRYELSQRTWERGVGETQACGTGACAAAVASVRMGVCDFPLVVNLIGGRLVFDVDSATAHILMTGPAVLVYKGEIQNRF